MEKTMILKVKVDGLEQLNGAIERAIEAVKILNTRDKLAKAYLAGRLAGVRARQEIENKPPKTDCRYPEDCDPGMVLKDRLKQVAELRRKIFILDINRINVDINSINAIIYP